MCNKKHSLNLLVTSSIHSWLHLFDLMFKESSKGGIESVNVADNEGDNWTAHCRLDRSAAPASGWVDSFTLAQPTFSLFACPTNSSTAPGNRNETNFSFSNWLLPTKSQSGPNLNWPAKSLPAVFSRISKS